MTREQLEAHLVLLGWFAVNSHDMSYLAHADGRWATGKRHETGLTYGTDHAGALRASLAAMPSTMPAGRFLACTDAMREAGWL